MSQERPQETPDHSAGYRSQFNWSEWSPAEAVIQTVAIATNREPTAMSPLYDSIGPDALDTLIGGELVEDSGVSVIFSFEGHEVTVKNNGEVTVTPEHDTR